MQNFLNQIYIYWKKHGAKETAGKILRRIRGKRQQEVCYEQWLTQHLPTEKELLLQKDTAFPFMPLYCIIVCTHSKREEDFEALIESLECQSYPKWKLCRMSMSPEELPGDLKGDFFVFLHKDDILAPNALYECTRCINEEPLTDFLYSDEDKIEWESGRHFGHQMKPDFNMDLLCSCYFTGHLLAVKRSLLESTGGFRSQYKAMGEYDLVLRLSENAVHIVHIPRVLCHVQSEESEDGHGGEMISRNTAEAGRLAVFEHCRRMGIEAKVLHGMLPGTYHVRYDLQEEPLVSVIIPNKDHIEDLKRCIDAIQNKSSYRNIEYIIVENNSEKPETFAYYEKLQKENSNAKVVVWKDAFNYSAINNFGVRHAQGKYLLLLNNDTELMNADCIEELLGYCSRPDAGAVGAKLFYEDDTVQHAGVILGMGGIAGHAFSGLDGMDPGYCARSICVQEYSAVTAACMMIKRSDYKEVEGFSEELAVAFNDIDFCMKLRRIGKRIIYNPFAQMYHLESKSRGSEDSPEKVARFHKEIKIFEEKWKTDLEEGDPFYSPNLTLDTDREAFSLREIE